MENKIQVFPTTSAFKVPQYVLIVAPPRTGKTRLLKDLITNVEKMLNERKDNFEVKLVTPHDDSNFTFSTENHIQVVGVDNCAYRLKEKDTLTLIHSLNHYIFLTTSLCLDAPRYIPNYLFLGWTSSPFSYYDWFLKRFMTFEEFQHVYKQSCNKRGDFLVIQFPFTTITECVFRYPAREPSSRWSKISGEKW
jgi:hypothetical protein